MPPQDDLLLREMGLPTASIAAIRERRFKDKSYYRVRDRHVGHFLVSELSSLSPYRFRTLIRKQKETVQVSGRLGAHIRVRALPTVAPTGQSSLGDSALAIQ
jgi:hypothetical protein